MTRCIIVPSKSIYTPLTRCYDVMNVFRCTGCGRSATLPYDAACERVRIVDDVFVVHVGLRRFLQRSL